jgi:hypothetical protein
VMSLWQQDGHLQQSMLEGQYLMTQLLGSVGLVQGTYKINGWLRLIPLLDSLRRHLEPPKFFKNNENNT